MTYDAADNSIRSTALALACARERQIRARILEPRQDNEAEQRWFREGPRANAELDTLRRAG